MFLNDAAIASSILISLREDGCIIRSILQLDQTDLGWGMYAPSSAHTCPIRFVCVIYNGGLSCPTQSLSSFGLLPGSQAALRFAIYSGGISA
jgi:hypothetical protein